MGLCTPHDDPIGLSLYHSQVDIWVFLFMGTKAAVPLRVRHGPSTHEVVLLNVSKKVLERFMIFRTVFLVDVIGGDVNAVEGVQSHTPLEASPGALAQKPHHPHLLNQVLGALMNMGESVDLLPREV